MSKHVTHATVLAVGFCLCLVGCSQPTASEETAQAQATDSATESATAPAVITEAVAVSTTAKADQTQLKSDLTAQIDQYQLAAQAFAAQLQTSSDVVALQAAAQALTEQSVPMLTGFMRLQSDCTDYLQAAQAVVGQLDQLTPAQMEAKYHQDQALPSAPQHCYHAKDLLIHPASVVVLLNQPDPMSARLVMQDEINEVLGHIGLVRQSI